MDREPDALAEIVLDLESGSGRDFPFRGPSPDPSVAGQGGKTAVQRQRCRKRNGLTFMTGFDEEIP